MLELIYDLNYLPLIANSVNSAANLRRKILPGNFKNMRHYWGFFLDRWLEQKSSLEV